MALLLKNDRLIAARALDDASSSAIGTIHLGRIQNYVPNLKAFFVEIRKNEMCFLPERELCPGDSPKPGDELLVQITREPQKTKLASVTAQISLANDYAAVSLGHPGIGCSNKLSNMQKERLKAWIQEAGIIAFLSENPQIGLVIRTKAGECESEAEKKRFIAQTRGLLDEFMQMLQQAKHRTCFSCIRMAPSIYQSILEKFAVPHEYQEIITDEQTIYQELETIRNANANFHMTSVRLYQDPDFSLEKLYSLESKLKTATERRVWLKSGGYLIIEPTEALTVIDVNSGKFEASKKKAAEEMIFQVNREAAEEIAIQLRLRNLSGIIIVDFINMKKAEDKTALLELLTELVAKDTVLTVIVDITPLGLVEITRQKSYKTLAEQLTGRLSDHGERTD